MFSFVLYPIFLSKRSPGNLLVCIFKPTKHAIFSFYGLPLERLPNTVFIAVNRTNSSYLEDTLNFFFNHYLNGHLNI